MNINIKSVDDLSAAKGVLSGIKGDISSAQVTELTNLFSSKIWNTADAAGTTASIDNQIRQLQMLLDEIQADMDELYDQQKALNSEMQRNLDDMEAAQVEASKEIDNNVKEKQDAISSATDEAYRKYLAGEIEKDEIPSYIAKKVATSMPAVGAKLQSHLDAMDDVFYSIANCNDKITSILDEVNDLTSQFKTTEASIYLLQQLKASIPEHNVRADIAATQDNGAPFYNPIQEALGDKLIDLYKENKGAGAGDASAATAKLGAAVKGSGVNYIDGGGAGRKAELEGMTAEEKLAAVEEADLNKYSAVELMYLAGMDKAQAGYAIGQIFSGAHVGYNLANGKIILPWGHDAGVKANNDQLVAQYATLFGGEGENGEAEDGGDVSDRTDPIGWREGNDMFYFAIDRDNDNIFDGVGEFLGAEDGWAEVTAMDANNDGTLTAAELEAAGARIVQVNQDLTGGGNYGFNGVSASGFDSIDLDSYTQIDALKQTNLNGNLRLAEFDMTVDGETVVGTQTENSEIFNTTFFGHMEGEAYSFGLDQSMVQNLISGAAKPEDYTAQEQAQADSIEANAEDVQAEDEATVEDGLNDLAHMNATAGLGAENGVEDREEGDDDSDTTTTSSTANNDDVIPEEEPPVR